MEHLDQTEMGKTNENHHKLEFRGVNYINKYIWFLKFIYLSFDVVE